METIDLTPSWYALLPAYVAVLQDGNEAGRTAVISELRRMAQAADQWNDQAPALVSLARKLSTLEGEVGNPALMLEILSDEARAAINGRADR